MEPTERIRLYKGPALGWYVWRASLTEFDSSAYIPIAVDREITGDRKCVTVYYLRRTFNDGVGWVPLIDGSDRVSWSEMALTGAQTPLSNQVQARTWEHINPALLDRAVRRFQAVIADRDADVPPDDSDIDPRSGAKKKQDVDARVEEKRRENADLQRQLRVLTAKQEQQAQELERLKNRSLIGRLRNV